MPISFCKVCKKREGPVSATHSNCGGDEAFCTCSEVMPNRDPQVQQHPETEIISTAHSQYESSSEDEFNDADWLEAARGTLDDSLPPPTPLKLSAQMLTQHRSVMAKLDTAFKDVGVDDVFERVLNANGSLGTAGTLNARQMVLDAEIHNHKSKAKWLSSKLLPVFAKNQKMKFEATQWADGCYAKHPPDCFVPLAPDRLAAWSGSNSEMRVEYLQGMVTARNQDYLNAEIKKYNKEWTLAWTRKFVTAQELVLREHELMMTPEKITSYFKQSPAARGMKRKAIFVTIDD
jgi:hypothetical protein